MVSLDKYSVNLIFLSYEDLQSTWINDTWSLKSDKWRLPFWIPYFNPISIKNINVYCWTMILKLPLKYLNTNLRMFRVYVFCDYRITIDFGNSLMVTCKYA
jgi:hypothetical protein